MNFSQHDTAVLSLRLLYFLFIVKYTFIQKYGFEFVFKGLLSRTVAVCRYRPSDAYMRQYNLNTNGSYNGLSPGRRQAIICTNPGILLIRPLGTVRFNSKF